MSCNGCGGGHYRCLKCGFVGCDGDDCPSYFFESGFLVKEDVVLADLRNMRQCLGLFLQR